MSKPSYMIYRLSFENFMAGTPAASDKVVDDMTQCILDHLVDISFLDGNGEPTSAYGAAVLGGIAYVTIQKKKNLLTDIKDSHDKGQVDSYPDFSIVLDARNPQKEGIVLGIQRKTDCFSNTDTVRKGLEGYWHNLLWNEKQFGHNIALRQISSSNQFWKELERKIKGGGRLTSLHLDVGKLVDGDGLGEVLDEQVKEQADFFAHLLSFSREMGADNGGVFFNAADGKGLDLERAKKNLGMVVALSCRRGFVVKAQIDGSPDWITSEAAAALSSRLESRWVTKPEEGLPREEVDKENKEQLEKLTQWFDDILRRMEQIRTDQAGEQTRHTCKR